jgi:y4mF family transcriptional regulator
MKYPFRENFLEIDLLSAYISRSGKVMLMLNVATIGQIIRDERKELGLRQDELAAASGVGLRFLVELERGKSTVQMGKVLDVISALGCELQIKRPDGIVIAGRADAPKKDEAE